MPVCPNCGSECRDGAACCLGCGQALASGPENEPAAGLVSLVSVSDPAEAMALRVALEEAGIPVLLRTHGPITGELAELADDMTEDYAILLVPLNRLAEARELLAALRREPPQWPPGLEPEGEGEG